MRNISSKTNLSVLTSMVLGVWGISACGTGGNNQESKASGYVSQTDDRWTTSNIPVCFTQSSASLSPAKAMIRSTLESEYGALGLNFTGFGTCTSSSQGIRVAFTREEGSRVDRIGSRIKNVYLGIDGRSHACTPSVDYMNSNCLKNVALHEFGHALGLHHEMNRRDDFERCEADQTGGQGERDAVNMGDYDKQSVMNYCYLFERNEENLLTHLSPGDIATLKAIYEGPVASFEVLPPARVSSLSALNFRVKGTGVSSFAVKFGPEAGLDCTDSAGYSNFIDVSKTITGSAMAEFFMGQRNAIPQDDYKICLVGKNNQQTQSYTSYSSINVRML